MRVNSATGSPINQNSDLLQEVSAALRDGPQEPTVVQAIKAGNAHIIQQLDTLIQQGGGYGAGGPPTRGTGAGGPGPAGNAATDKQSQILLDMEGVLDRIEHAINIFSREGVGGAGGVGNSFTREAYLTAFEAAKRLTPTAEERANGGPSTTLWKELNGLIRQETIGNVRNLTAGFLRLGVETANLGGSFRNLQGHIREQLAQIESSGVFGSNALTPTQFLFEGFDRAMHGALMETDSYRIVLGQVNEALKSNIISPIVLTGRSVTELASDFNRARSDMRQMGYNSRGWMSTQDTNKALAALVDLQSRFGIQSQVTDIRTEMAQARDGMYLSKISASTGESVPKLEALLQETRRNNSTLIGLGRLNQGEFTNFTANATAIQKMFPELGKDFTQQIANLYRLGKTPEEIMVNADDEMRRFMSGQPALFNALISSMNAMKSGQMSPDQITHMLSRFGANQAGGGFTNLTSTQQLQLYPGLADRIAGLVTLGNQSGAVSSSDAAVRAHEQTNPLMVAGQTLREVFQNYIQPFLGLEAAVGASTVAMGLNIRALYMNTAALTRMAAMTGLGGIGSVAAEGGAALGFGSRLLRGATRAMPIVGGLAAGGIEYAESGSATRGIATGLGTAGGAAAGAWIGGMLGSFVPILGNIVGAAVGSVIGGAIGGYGGHEVGMALDPGRRSFAGPDQGSPTTAAPLQFEGTGDLLTRILNVNADQIGWLAQIRGELGRQTSILSGTPSPAGAPAIGMGLKVESVAARASGRPDDSYPAQ